MCWYNCVSESKNNIWIYTHYALTEIVGKLSSSNEVLGISFEVTEPPARNVFLVGLRFEDRGLEGLIGDSTSFLTGSGEDLGDDGGDASNLQIEPSSPNL